MKRVLNRLINFIVVDGNMYVSCNISTFVCNFEPLKLLHI